VRCRVGLGAACVGGTLRFTFHMFVDAMDPACLVFQAREQNRLRGAMLLCTIIDMLTLQGDIIQEPYSEVIVNIQSST
jgi:hypothetical protein